MRNLVQHQIQVPKTDAEGLRFGSHRCCYGSECRRRAAALPSIALPYQRVVNLVRFAIRMQSQIAIRSHAHGLNSQ